MNAFVDRRRSCDDRDDLATGELSDLGALGIGPGERAAQHGVTIRDRQRGTSAFYAPALLEPDQAVFDAMCNADAVLVDGTFWTDDEMIRLGLSTQTARAMGHLALSGSGGMLEWLQRLPLRVRRCLIHVNNTNPILDEDSAERAVLAEAGVEV